MGNASSDEEFNSDDNEDMYRDYGSDDYEGVYDEESRFYGTSALAGGSIRFEKAQARPRPDRRDMAGADDDESSRGPPASQCEATRRKYRKMTPCSGCQLQDLVDSKKLDLELGDVPLEKNQVTLDASSVSHKFDVRDSDGKWKGAMCLDSKRQRGPDSVDAALFRVHEKRINIVVPLADVCWRVARHQSMQDEDASFQLRHIVRKHLAHSHTHWHTGDLVYVRPMREGEWLEGTVGNVSQYSSLGGKITVNARAKPSSVRETSIVHVNGYDKHEVKTGACECERFRNVAQVAALLCDLIEPATKPRHSQQASSDGESSSQHSALHQRRTPKKVPSPHRGRGRGRGRKRKISDEPPAASSPRPAKRELGKIERRVLEKHIIPLVIKNAHTLTKEMTLDLVWCAIEANAYTLFSSICLSNTLGDFPIHSSMPARVWRSLNPNAEYPEYRAYFLYGYVQELIKGGHVERLRGLLIPLKKEIAAALLDRVDTKDLWTSLHLACDTLNGDVVEMVARRCPPSSKKYRDASGWNPAHVLVHAAGPECNDSIKRCARALFKHNGRIFNEHIGAANNKRGPTATTMCIRQRNAELLRTLMLSCGANVSPWAVTPDNPIWACIEEGAWGCLEVLASGMRTVLCTSESDPVHRASRCKKIRDGCFSSIKDSNGVSVWQYCDADPFIKSLLERIAVKKSAREERIKKSKMSAAVRKRRKSPQAAAKAAGAKGVQAAERK